MVVLGGGAAGLSASLVLFRARRKVAVVDAGKPRNAPAAHRHGYLSRDGLPPRDLLEAGRAEIAAYGVQLLAGIVSTVSGTTESGFELLENGDRLNARRLVIATGLR